MRFLASILMVLFFAVPFSVFADDAFDGTKTLLCATIEAHGCTRGEQCEKGLSEDFGAPQFMRIDFGKKEIIGPKRTTQIQLMEKTDDQITIQGFEVGMGWVLALDRETGKMTVTLANGQEAFVIFGACTPYPSEK